jgi:AraC-like DNA-binding protein
VDGPAFYFDEPPSILLEQLMQRIITLYRGAMADADMAEKFLGMASHLMGSLLRELEFRRALPGDWRSSAPERRYRIVDRFMEILQGDDKSRLTVTEAARVLGFSTDHFIRLVKQETGRTPKTIILEMRINEAKNLLIRTLLNVSEIAYELGYEDVFSFSQQFKAKTGVSPSAFRKSFEMRADATSISNNHKD